MTTIIVLIAVLVLIVGLIIRKFVLYKKKRLQL
jgi:hypothetical protein